MVLRKLHIDKRKSPVAFADACDECVVGHIRFSSARLKDSCLNARGKIESWQQCWQQLAVFEGKFFGFFKWWSRWDSNPRPPRCHRGALPTAPRPHLGKAYFDYALPRENHDLPGFTGTRSQLRHGPTWEKLTSTTHCPGKTTIFPVSPGRAPNCATAPLGKSSLRLRTARGKH